MQFIYPHLKSLHEEGQNSIPVVNRSHLNGLYPFHTLPGTIKPQPDVSYNKLFQTFETDEANSLPLVAECATHLELLEAFYTLRVRVIQSAELDKLYKVEPPDDRTRYRRQPTERGQKDERVAVKIRDERFLKGKKRKWEGFVQIAVTRFVRWAGEANKTLLAGKGRPSDCSDPLYLPPLDILMVWHAFLLNPLDFEDYCNRKSWGAIHKVPFPWAQIHQAIDPKDSSFKLDMDSKRWVYNTANLEPDLMGYLVKTGITSSPMAQAVDGYGGAYVQRQIGGITWWYSPLRDNVLRQVSFVDKMRSYLWSRSPAAEGTLRRAIDRYDKFLQLIKQHPGVNLVPAIDIDLVWHTDQCSASQYKSSMIQRTNQFLNHNDKLGDTVLDDGLEKTKELYFIRFGQPYIICQCWNCEALLSAVENSDEIALQDTDGIARLADQVDMDVYHCRWAESSRRFQLDPD